MPSARRVGRALAGVAAPAPFAAIVIGLPRALMPTGRSQVARLRAELGMDPRRRRRAPHGRVRRGAARRRRPESSGFAWDVDDFESARARSCAAGAPRLRGRVRLPRRRAHRFLGQPLRPRSGAAQGARSGAGGPPRCRSASLPGADRRLPHGLARRTVRGARGLLRCSACARLRRHSTALSRRALQEACDARTYRFKADRSHLKSSSCPPVLSKKATLSLEDQITSQSPAFATWHSLRPDQLPVSACMLCRVLRISSDSGEFSTTRSMTFSNSERSHPLLRAFLLRSRLKADEKSAVSLAIRPSPPLSGRDRSQIVRWPAKESPPPLRRIAGVAPPAT